LTKKINVLATVFTLAIVLAGFYPNKVEAWEWDEWESFNCGSEILWVDAGPSRPDFVLWCVISDQTTQQWVERANVIPPTRNPNMPGDCPTTCNMLLSAKIVGEISRDMYVHVGHSVVQFVSGLILKYVVGDHYSVEVGPGQVGWIDIAILWRTREMEVAQYYRIDDFPIDNRYWRYEKIQSKDLIFDEPYDHFWEGYVL